MDSTAIQKISSRNSLGDRCDDRGRDKLTIEMTTELLRPALLGERYRLRGDVVRLTRLIGYGEASVTNGDGKLVSRSTGTFLVQRDEPGS